MNEIKGSQQASQGINIGNQGGAMPEGANVPHEQQDKDDRYILNQDRSSGKSEKKKED